MSAWPSAAAKYDAATKPKASSTKKNIPMYTRFLEMVKLSSYFEGTGGPSYKGEDLHDQRAEEEKCVQYRPHKDEEADCIVILCGIGAI